MKPIVRDVIPPMCLRALQENIRSRLSDLSDYVNISDDKLEEILIDVIDTYGFPILSYEEEERFIKVVFARNVFTFSTAAGLRRRAIEYYDDVSVERHDRKICGTPWP